MDLMWLTITEGFKLVEDLNCYWLVWLTTTVQDDGNDSGILIFGFNHEMISRGVLDFYWLIWDVAIAETTFCRFQGTCFTAQLSLPHGNLLIMVSCLVCEKKSRSSVRVSCNKLSYTMRWLCSRGVSLDLAVKYFHAIDCDLVKPFRWLRALFLV